MRNEEITTGFWGATVTDSEDKALSEYIDRYNDTRPPNTRKLSKSAVIRQAVAIFLRSEYENALRNEA